MRQICWKDIMKVLMIRVWIAVWQFKFIFQTSAAKYICWPLHATLATVKWSRCSSRKTYDFGLPPNRDLDLQMINMNMNSAAI